MGQQVDFFFHFGGRFGLPWFAAKDTLASFFSQTLRDTPPSLVEASYRNCSSE
jgi:hypothetical protein